MKTLIICIDRDDDIGRKTEIKSPIIGRKENLDAALAMGIADPEDADMNAIFYAIKLYDEYINTNKDAEIVTICGDANVGEVSDKKIAEHVENVLTKIKPDSGVLVSDGEEDEYILPILTSRLKIDGVRRISVKQAPTIETTYYFLAKAMRDEKIQKKFVIPIGLFILIISICSLFGYPNIGWAIVGIVIGSYIMIIALNLEHGFFKICKDIKVGLMTGKISLFIGLIGVIVFIIGMLVSFGGLALEEINIKIISTLIGNIVWWAIIAILIILFGKVIETYIKKKQILWSYAIFPFSLVVCGLIIFITVDIINNLFLGYRLLFRYEIIIKVLLAMLVAFAGYTIWKYIKEYFEEEPDWRR